jgi:NarL family two-component system response regulator LiaR
MVMSPLRVAIIDPHEIVVAGAAHLLARHPERVTLVRMAGPDTVDVVLYGIDEGQHSHDLGLHRLRRDASATVVAFGWERESLPASLAIACGAHGFISKQLPSSDLVEQLEQVHRRHVEAQGIVARPPDDCRHPDIEAAGLTGREIEVLSLIADGLSNDEIARRLYLSINSIKTYIRSAYRKIQVARRSQATAWARSRGLGEAMVDNQGAGGVLLQREA